MSPHHSKEAGQFPLGFLLDPFSLLHLVPVHLSPHIPTFFGPRPQPQEGQDQSRGPVREHQNSTGWLREGYKDPLKGRVTRASFGVEREGRVGGRACEVLATLPTSCLF